MPIITGLFTDFRASLDNLPNCGPCLLTQFFIERKGITIIGDKIPRKLRFQFITPKGKKVTNMIRDVKYLHDNKILCKIKLEEGKDSTLHITGIEPHKEQGILIQ